MPTQIEFTNFISKYPVTQRFANIYTTYHQRGLINERSKHYKDT